MKANTNILLIKDVSIKLQLKSSIEFDYGNCEVKTVLFGNSTSHERKTFDPVIVY